MANDLQNRSIAIDSVLVGVRLRIVNKRILCNPNGLKECLHPILRNTSQLLFGILCGKEA